MRKNGVRLVLLVAAVIGICCIPHKLSAWATQSQIDKVNDNIDKLEHEQEKKQEVLEELEADKAYLKGKLSKLNRQLEQLAQELTDLQEQLIAKEADILLNTDQLEAAREEEKQQYENMKKRIRFLYERGDSSLLEIFLEAGSFADFINLSDYVQSIYTYDRQMLEQYRIVKEEIAAREIQLEEEQQELIALTTEQQDKIGQVEILVAEVKANIDTTNQQIADAKDKIAANEAELERQRAYEEELEAKKAEEDAKRLEEIKKQEAENLAPPIISDSVSDIAMLAALIECEAGGESYEGKLAVGSVVMNRASAFPVKFLPIQDYDG